MAAEALIGQRLQSVLQIQPCCFLGSAIVCRLFGAAGAIDRAGGATLNSLRQLMDLQ
jgi:hypothetical protein